jgi:hypothetical protein
LVKLEPDAVKLCSALLAEAQAVNVLSVPDVVIVGVEVVTVTTSVFWQPFKP